MNTHVSFWNDVGRFLNEVHADREFQFSPPVEVEEKEGAFEIEVDLPGVPKDQVKIELNENTLHIRGERKARGKFERVLRVPQTVNREAIEANIQDGVLRLVLPKAELAKPRSIEIKAA